MHVCELCWWPASIGFPPLDSPPPLLFFSTDFLRVRETAAEPPNEDDGKTFINAPEPLSREATLINQYYSQQALDVEGTPIDFGNESPFAEDASVADVGYTYRKFEYESSETEVEKITFVVRTQVDAYTIKSSGRKAMTVHALHEYDPTLDLNWRSSLDTQGGAVLATEIKNSANRLARVTARAIAAGNDLVHLGFVTRTNPAKHIDHSVLGTQTMRTETLARQLQIVPEALWVSAAAIVDSALALGEGTYVLMKDANESVLRFFAVPDNFEEELAAGPSFA